MLSTPGGGAGLPLELVATSFGKMFNFWLLFWGGGGGTRSVAGLTAGESALIFLALGSDTLVTNSILLRCIFTIRDQCRKVRFIQMQSQGLRQLFFDGVWGHLYLGRLGRHT